MQTVKDSDYIGETITDADYPPLRRHDDKTETATAVIRFMEYVGLFVTSALFASVIIAEVLR